MMYLVPRCNTFYEESGIEMGFAEMYSSTNEVYLTFCHQISYEDVIAMPHIVDGSCILTFPYIMSYTCICQLFCLTCHVRVIDSLKQTGSQVANTHTLRDLTFLEPYDCNKVTTESDSPSVSVRNFLQ
jgi:hypothetical protein